MWMAGDFGRVAQYGARAAEELVATLPIPPAARVLDIACGTGNLSIPAARRGAVVTGIDIAPNLLEQARNRARIEGLDISFEESNAEALPYADGKFDVIMGLFGAMFAPNAERVAAEMTRVCRPGGTVLMANWTSRGFFGRVFDLGGRYMPSKAGAVSPVLWGEEDTVRQRLGNRTTSLRMQLRNFPLEFPFGPVQVVDLFRRYFGPTIAIFSRLDANSQDAYRRGLEALWESHNEAGNDRTLVQAEYLEVVAIRGN